MTKIAPLDVDMIFANRNTRQQLQDNSLVPINYRFLVRSWVMDVFEAYGALEIRTHCEFHRGHIYEWNQGRQCPNYANLKILNDFVKKKLAEREANEILQTKQP